MSQHLGLDLGAATTVIYQKGKGIVLREPTVAAVDTRGNVIAVGTKAILIHGRSPGTVTLRRPLEAGNVTDFNLMAETLDSFLELAAPKSKKHVTASVKYSFGSHNREVFTKALSDCHTGKITLADNTLAALLGCGENIDDNENCDLDGTVICDIGAGSAEVAYIRQGELLRTKTLQGAGDTSDTAIIAYIRRKYGVAITKSAAREAKHKLNLTESADRFHTFAGTDGSSGMPRRVKVVLSELIRPCAPQLDHVADLLKDLLSNLPRQGENISTASRIILVGGGVNLPGCAEYISAKLGREVISAKNPADCVALGLGTIIEQKTK